MEMGSPSGVTEHSGTRQRWWLHNLENALNAPELFTLKWFHLRHTNFTPIEKKKPSGSTLEGEFVPEAGASDRIGDTSHPPKQGGRSEVQMGTLDIPPRASQKIGPIEV